QTALEDLPRRVLRQLCDELHPFGHLETGQPGPDVRDHLVTGELALVGLEHDERGDGLDPLLVGAAAARHLSALAAFEARVLDLSTGHQHTAGVDAVLDPVDDLDVPVLVDLDPITGREPAVVEGLGRGFGTIPVAFAQLWGAVEHLSLTAGPDVLTGCVDDSRLDEHHRSAGRTRVSV